jgi:hypothetical protein
MKKYSYILLFFITFSFIGCEDFVDLVPDDVATIDNAFVDAYSAESYLFTCYKYMPNLAGWSTNPALLGTNNFWVHDNTSIASARLGNLRGSFLAKGEQSRNTVLFDYWNGSEGGTDLYEGIRHCNILIERIREVKEMSPEEHLRYISEAKFLKAYYHYYLIKLYGPIPIVDKNISVSESTKGVKVYRENIEDCFDYVIGLLEDSYSSLPKELEDPGIELGRVTQLICKSLIAKVKVTRASPFFNGNNLSMVDNTGKELFKNTFDKQKWIDAAAACKEAIDLAEAAGHELYYYVNSRGYNDTTAARMNIRGSVVGEWNTELIWGYSRRGAMRDYQRRCTPTWVPDQPGVHGEMQQGVQPTINAAEMFYSKNGLPINEDVNYNYDDRFDIANVDDSHKWHMLNGSKQPKFHLNREIRFYASLAFDNSVWMGHDEYNDESPRIIECRVGKRCHNGTNFTGYFLKKNVYEENTYAKNSSSILEIPFPIIRLSDLYLLYAEALNETVEEGTTPPDDVYEYVNRVRARASLPTVQYSWSNFSKINTEKHSTNSGMREIIKHERMIELFGEGHKFWDLRRWNDGLSMLNNNILAWSCENESVEDYLKVRVVYNQKFLQRDYLWPIREGDIIKNPNLLQNYGW